jgi:hypothetical protein
MGIPVLGLCGNAGSGKNYIASIISNSFSTIELAISDPIKRLLNQCLMIHEDVLWGESSLREKSLEHIPEGFEYQFESNVETFVQEIASTAKMDNRASQLENACTHWFQNNKKDIRKRTCRQILQELGTDVCRNISNDIWSDYANNTIIKLLTERRQYSAKLGIGKISSSSYPDLIIVTDVRFANELIGIKRMGGKICQVLSTEKKVHQHISETEQLSFPNHWFDFIIVNDKTVSHKYTKELFNQRVTGMAKTITTSNWI